MAMQSKSPLHRTPVSAARTITNPFRMAQAGRNIGGPAAALYAERDRKIAARKKKEAVRDAADQAHFGGGWSDDSWDGGGGDYYGSSGGDMFPSFPTGGSLQDPVGIGSIGESFSFFEVEVDPNGSQAAAEAIARSDIQGESILRGLFLMQRPPIRE